jgi:hypothetical protein
MTSTLPVTSTILALVDEFWTHYLIDVKSDFLVKMSQFSIHPKDGQNVRKPLTASDQQRNQVINFFFSE